MRFLQKFFSLLLLTSANPPVDRSRNFSGVLSDKPPEIYSDSPQGVHSGNLPKSFFFKSFEKFLLKILLKFFSSSPSESSTRSFLESFRNFLWEFFQNTFLKISIRMWIRSTNSYRYFFGFSLGIPKRD